MKLQPRQRGAFAKEHCGDDPQLFRDLLVLLQNAERPDDSLDRPLGRINPKVGRPPNRPMSGGKRLVVDGYQLVRPLGRGGMGKVFEAIDRKTGATVAIKFIQTRGAFSEERRLRFLLEARGMASMRHSNIVELYDIGQSQGQLYLVMEYLKGRSLRSWLSQGQLPQHFSDILRLLGQTARALAFAHAQGFVHGDVKPDNIMVLQDGTAKLIDFGLAQREVLPGSLGAGGTAGYMAPELLASPRATATAASDIWALGITLLECLTGKLPFTNPTQTRSSMTHHRLSDEAPLAVELNGLIDQVLRKDPAERLNSAERVAQELERLGAVDGTGPVEERARDAADEGQHEAYASPDLGLSSEWEGTVQAGMRDFVWRQRQLRFTWRAGVFTAMLAVYAALFMALGWAVRSPILFFACLCSLLGCWLLWCGPWAVFSFFCAFEKRRFCESCGLAMRKTSSWTRFATETTEVVYGRGDCMAALKHGLWQEAAKLISIHGKESTIAEGNILISPARFRLEFFECDGCLDQAARLIAEEIDGAEFRPRPEYFEAYRRLPEARRSVSLSVPRPRGAAALLQRSWEVVLLRRKTSAFRAMGGYFRRTFEPIIRIRRSIGSIRVGAVPRTVFVAVCLIGVLDFSWVNRSSPRSQVITPPAPLAVESASDRYSEFFAHRVQSHPLDVCVAELRKSAQGPPDAVFHPYRPRKGSADARLSLKNFTCQESRLSFSECRVYCTPR